MSEQYFTVIKWHVEDLKNCFKLRGIPATEENIAIFLNSRAPKTLDERSIEKGYEILDALISDLSNEFCISDEPEIIIELIDIGWSGVTYEEVIEGWNVLLSNSQDQTLSEIYAIIQAYNEGVYKYKEKPDIVVDEIMDKLSEVFGNYYSERQAEYMSLYL
ncbi:hypothetical protein COL70_08845 [Bacillus pseudomycoides]|uniref:hypothetical protein n=1 Tax=Bacillus pseudomycoides TaxID=64104 RepID=UPI000BF4F8CB|nr:hypothetical protein [Bacillus pseudomycoides]PFZ93714.1 hypothetical protein COL70_08845 [Bacillus pseudomycoides]